ncbi:LOW QUALITY PROTEIN: killer cell lectin-like receptor subfamily F member 2 [Vulpes lagopus]|uniref:LOW QUALITY PROTEIN: killer cell lectin-like receptor subfamily F member 2 n=1 Tax=Vulpes lagopus TaxID=494514 RepID=UPI001BC93CA3|nr:LOW QUALITY PROTEIN: killer cell lectin-like receptor subfamily F member 2 [Vulpes lagopus]
MENADGYMVLDYKNHFKFRQKSKGFSLYLQYYCLMLVCSCIGILIFMITLICLNFWGNNYLCSKDWLLNQEKCYMFSISSKTWNKKPEFIQRTLKPGSPGWIGLYVTSPGKWMWINKHPFNDEAFLTMFLGEQHEIIFLIIGPTDHKRCALITGNQEYSEDCNSKFNGICQRDAF